MVENKLCFSIRGEFGVQLTFEAKEELPYWKEPSTDSFRRSTTATERMTFLSRWTY